MGFDGGGTGTQAEVLDTLSEKRQSYQLGPTNRHSVGDVQVQATLEAFFKDLQKSGIDLDQVESICFGGAGVDTQEDEQVVHAIFRNLGYEGKLRIVNDSVTALVGANRGYEGAILISGTGSIALGVGPRGEMVRVGGWGHLIDDTGSAYAIARDGICEVLKAHDGRSGATRIWKGLKGALDIERPEELLDFIYAEGRQKQEIAAFAPLVTQLAGKDQLADKIMEKAIDDLFCHIRALTVKLRSQAFELSYVGSVLEKSDEIRYGLTDRIQETYPNIEVHFPRSSPVEGALILAQNAIE